MKTSEYEKGDRVLYIPDHAEGDPEHSDCQPGIVSSTNESFVFVKYWHIMTNGTKWPPIETGDEPYAAQATKTENLRRA